MENEIAAWQLDMFGGASPIVAPPPAKVDPLPDPQFWSEGVREKMVDALISLATDSRRGDNMPESLMDCCTLFSERLRNRKKLEMEDYRATLGWVMEFWDGALPYRYVCLINGVDPEILQDLIMSNPLLKRDMEDVRHSCFGSLL
ncbi:hypothetical protein ACFQ3P_33175 [Paraburkholderia sabiae]|uniref:Uncharacterized protein n=1 Tax=Paraburkholderia sabiae TaxID=273251 RepID=A0ABU9QJ64_9BURK|nr:hypothetical protein [Paraburkholderia sabiae]WJZ79806.1 hypothetical protein QEN71_44005 [Paraburkholderia sabiae]CAD6559210.1 hypothetical protein LMG24235_06592 [Paraburkholderia sabiae]